MHHALTDEQIEKASGYLLAAFNWVLSDAELNQLATHLQFAPPQLSGDVVEAMIEVYRRRLSSAKLPSYAEEMREAMTAAAQVLLDRVCGPVTNEERQRHFFRNLIDSEPRTMLTSDVRFDEIMKDRLNSLLKPAEPTMEEELSKFAWETVITNKDWTRESLQAGMREILTRRAGATHD